jgi:hypothetical protein
LNFGVGDGDRGIGCWVHPLSVNNENEKCGNYSLTALRLGLRFLRADWSGPGHRSETLERV